MCMHGIVNNVCHFQVIKYTFANFCHKKIKIHNPEATKKEKLEMQTTKHKVKNVKPPLLQFTENRNDLKHKLQTANCKIENTIYKIQNTDKKSCT